jgi:site-specific recombinase XerD
VVESTVIPLPGAVLAAPAGDPWDVASWELAREPSARTRAQYRGVAAQFARFLDAHGLTLATADRQAVALFLSGAGTAHRRRASSQNLYLVILRHIYRSAQARGLVAVNPVATMRGARVKRVPRAYLTVPEVDAVFAAMGDDLLSIRDRALLGAAFETGMRRSELVSLRIRDLRLLNGYWILEHAVKGDMDDVAGEDRTNPVVSRIRPYVHGLIRAWLDAAGPRPDDAPLFVAILKRGQARRGEDAVYSIPDPMRPLHPTVVTDRLRAWVTRAGLDPSGLSAHSIRRSLITNAYRAGASTRVIQLTVHHERGETTERYDQAAGAIEQTAADYLPYRFAPATGDPATEPEVGAFPGQPGVHAAPTN